MVPWTLPSLAEVRSLDNFVTMSKLPDHSELQGFFVKHCEG